MLSPLCNFYLISLFNLPLPLTSLALGLKCTHLSRAAAFDHNSITPGLKN